MPAATAPIGKPVAKGATTGFTKPAGLSRQTAPAKEADDEEEAAPLDPVKIGISALVALLAALFLYAAYSGDQTPNRVSEYLFGQPQAVDSSSGGSYATADDDDDDDADSAASSDSSADEEEDDEEE